MKGYEKGITKNPCGAKLLHRKPVIIKLLSWTHPLHFG